MNILEGDCNYFGFANYDLIVLAGVTILFFQPEGSYQLALGAKRYAKSSATKRNIDNIYIPII